MAVRLGLCFFLGYALFSHGHFAGSDEVAIYRSTQALYHNGDFAIEWVENSFEGRDGRSYAVFAVGQSVLALPFYALGDLAQRHLSERSVRALSGRKGGSGIDATGTPGTFAVSFFPPLASGVLVGLFFLFQRRLGVSRRNALLATALLGTTTYVATLSVYFLRHTAETIAIVGALYGFHAFGAGGRLRALAAGAALASSLVLIRMPAAAAGPGLAGYLLFVMAGRRRLGQRLAPMLVAVAVPTAVVFAAWAGVNHWKWGTWLTTPMFGQLGAFLTPLRVGAAGLLLSPGSSVFLYSPLLLLLPWTLPRLWRAEPGLCASAVAISLTLLVVGAKFVFWHGLWSAPGPRMIFAATPLLCLALGPWLDASRGRAARGAVAALAVLGASAQLALVTARWRDEILGMDYLRYAPDMDFLFQPSLSPIVGSARIALAGGIDPWLWGLWHGVPGWEPAPVAAAVLFGVWALCFGAALWALRRACARAEEAAATP